ncbi:hypothetical protein [Motiliproteus sp. SC1-56]|uniref:hypothetical protein n=1 Tax=Motiliproteus sp. SC1-56 TaxID=2799565 RepID=UPI001A908CB9|nr:hypothetical protein [Motiliproteus sp. SC1-56]
MGYSRLSDRLAFDIKFLLWRAEVHVMSPEEIASRYREIEQRYLSLAEEREDQEKLRAEIASWRGPLSQVAGLNGRAPLSASTSGLR